MEVVYDIVAFLSILITTTFAFALLFHLSDEKTGFLNAFIEAYRINFSDF